MLPEKEKEEMTSVLVDMGFKAPSVGSALAATDFQMDAAIQWLLQNEAEEKEKAKAKEKEKAKEKDGREEEEMDGAGVKAMKECVGEEGMKKILATITDTFNPRVVTLIAWVSLLAFPGHAAGRSRPRCLHDLRMPPVMLPLVPRTWLRSSSAFRRSCLRPHFRQGCTGPFSFCGAPRATASVHWKHRR